MVTGPVGIDRRPTPPSESPVRIVVRAIKRLIKRTLSAVGKRFPGFRTLSRSALRTKRIRNYRMHLEHTVVNEKMVLFQSFMGRGFSDNPKALYQAMLADPRFDDFTLVWALKRPLEFIDEPALERAHIVRYNSQQHYAAYAQSKYWISNSIIHNHVEPRTDQVYVQTWHGTPLKRLGCDIAQSGISNVKHTSDEIWNRYSLEGRKFTYLLSPSGFASEKLGSAFCLSPEVASLKIIEEGYPRNDAMSTFCPDDITRIRAELGVPAGKKAILYAPTWRDDQHVTGVGWTLSLPVDFDHLQSELGDEYVILFRAHYFIANEFDFERHGGFVINVSDVPDINDLYVVSDLLVTDYSSVFFDYANLNRPMVFYMYDLETYAQDLRGFYIDLAELPGPIVRTEDELVSAIRSASTPGEELMERYSRFSERFTYLDDGHASERVIQRVFAEPDRATRTGAADQTVAESNTANRRTC